MKLTTMRDALRELVRRRGGQRGESPGTQDLEPYWAPDMADALETWGEGNAWLEIQFLLAGRRGRVLDIACGTGKVISMLSANTSLDLHGIDVSDLLLRRATARGIPQAALTLGDATRLGYPDDSFDYAYSIGSLEHFTESGIAAFLGECRRVVRFSSFHMIPISRGADQGWIRRSQSYFNNGVDWWLPRFRSAYDDVAVLPSSWSDSISVGRWFVCTKRFA
jgi:ubiquinone/menaquinone biosynthesis C-methylase UbiE